MRPCADLRVLFRVAAGPRRGFGHLVRARSLARALGVRPLVAIRGGERVVHTALALGCDVVGGGASPKVIDAMKFDVVIVDDPIAKDACRWIGAARRAGCLVVSIHDLGIGCLDADLVVDGSATRTARARRGATLAGTRYAVLDPTLSGRRRTAGSATRVLISLGGGPRAARASAIAHAIAQAQPMADIRIVGGFMSGFVDGRQGRITWTEAPRGLGDELSRADVAVVGGGVSLYEACALGVPAVGVPVVRAQEPTVAALGRRGAALAVPRVTASAGAVARRAARLLADAGLRARVARSARTIVDGRGASRVASTIAVMAERRAARSARSAGAR
jgi:spore coat polysaccharide biosynthesis predicted glycosyltransferase SpsG